MCSGRDQREPKEYGYILNRRNNKLKQSWSSVELRVGLSQTCKNLANSVSPTTSFTALLAWKTRRLERPFTHLVDNSGISAAVFQRRPIPAAFIIQSLRNPPPTTPRVTESAPSESSKGDRGGSESSHLKHRVPLFSGGACIGDRKSNSVRPRLFRNTKRSLTSAEPEDRMPLSLLRKASAFTGRRAGSFCSVQMP